MYHVQFDLPKAEWLRIMAMLRQTWPSQNPTIPANETLILIGFRRKIADCIVGAGTTCPGGMIPVE